MNKEKTQEIELLALEKRILKLEGRRMSTSFENSFFLPLFMLIFYVSVFTTSDTLKVFLFMLAVLLIIMDLISAYGAYLRLKRKLRHLEHLIKEKSERMIE